MEDEVIEFINRRFKEDCHWQDGNCYYFAVILKARFPRGKIMYDPILNHFLFKYKNKVYDSLGESQIKGLIPWDKYKDFDKSDYNRVVKYCIK